jgi:hypothetical protein
MHAHQSFLLKRAYSSSVQFIHRRSWKLQCVQAMTTDWPLVIPMAVVLHACDAPLQQAAAHQQTSSRSLAKAPFGGAPEADRKSVDPGRSYIEVCETLQALMLSYSQFGSISSRFWLL